MSSRADEGEGKMALKVTRCEFLFGIPCSQVADRMIKIEDENDRLREQALRAYNLAATEFCWLKKPESREKIEAHLDEIDGFLTDIKRKLAELGVDEWQRGNPVGDIRRLEGMTR